MPFYAEITYGRHVCTDCLTGVPDLSAAKSDALRTMAEILRSGFDGCGRTVSARISDKDDQLVSAMSLTLAVQDG